jgi:hypothetical protein
LEIKREVARALLKIAEPQVAHLVELLKNSDPSRRDGISWALAKTGGFNPREVLQNADDNLRRWISYIITSAFSPLNPSPFWTLPVTASLLNLIIDSSRPKPEHFPNFTRLPAQEYFLKSCFSISTTLFNISIENQQYGIIKGRQIFPLTLTPEKSTLKLSFPAEP